MDIISFRALGVFNVQLVPFKSRWLLKLSQIPEVSKVPSFSGEAQSYLQGLIDGFTINDALEVKNVEKVTNHDVKVVEYCLKQKCQSHLEIAKKKLRQALVAPVESLLEGSEKDTWSSADPLA